MRHSTKGEGEQLPVLSNSKIVETQSRPIFEQAVSPWMVTHWYAHDLGIDAMVEIASRTFGEDDYRATGKRFGVQLKATEGDLTQCGSVQVSVDKVFYWHEATEPTLLVACHLPSKKLFCRWIDDELIDELKKNSPGWRTQKTVTISVDTNRPLVRSQLKHLESFVRSLRRVPLQSLKPGVYLKALKSANQTVDDLLGAARGVGFGSVEKRLESAALAIRRCTYEVAITGPSRAGKSTLINSLLGVEISPVDEFPTTAVAIRAIPGERDEAEVLFLNGKRKVGDPSSAFLSAYATQSENEDNKKGVEVINVRLDNPLLAQGLAFLDAPGLHDASPEIRAITAAALKKANAVVYVLEVASAATGGFSLPEHVIGDLKKLQEAADKLFLVLNKADVLDDPLRKKVESYIAFTLKKHGVWKELPHEPIFLSARDAWQWRNDGSVGPSPCKELEDAIWAHLLETSATGSKRLALLVQEIARAGQEFATLLATRRLTSVKAGELEAALAKCLEDQGSIVRDLRSRIAEEERWTREILPSMQDALLAWLRRRLEAVPIDQELPDPVTLREEIQGALIRVTAECWKRTANRLAVLASQVSSRIEGSLRQARLATGIAPAVEVDAPALDVLEIPSGKTFEEGVAGMLSGGLIGALFGGWGIVIGIAGGWLAGIIMGRKNQRKREIDHVINRIDSKINKVIQCYGSTAGARVKAFGKAIEETVNDRIGVYVHDARAQLQKTGRSLDHREDRKIRQTESKVKAILDAHEKGVLEMLPKAMSPSIR